ncbi:hypothetical protein [Salana multivorans]
MAARERQPGRRRGVASVATVLGVVLATAGLLAGCRSQAPMLQPVAPVPTVTQG